MHIIQMMFGDVRAIARWLFNLDTAVIVILAVFSGLVYGNVHELLTERVPAITLLPFAALGACYVLIGTEESKNMNRLFAFRRAVLFQGVFAGAAMVGMLVPWWLQPFAVYVFIGLCFGISVFRKFQITDRLIG